MQIEYYLGIDGGATKTTFLLCKNDKIIKTVKKGASNPIDLGIKKATDILKEGITEILSGIDYLKVSVFAGLSGGISGDNKRLVSEFLASFNFGKANNGSDIENIVMAGLGEADGVAVIMGTGSTAFVQAGGEKKRLDGLGYLFSHGGCGYDIGNMGISSALKAEDGTGEPTIIRDLILAERGKKTLLEDLGYFYDIGKSGVASYSKIVMKAFKLGDKVATDIIRHNMKHVANLIVTGGKHINSKRVNVVLVGGLTAEIEILSPYINEYLKGDKNYNVKVFDKDVGVGALKLAGAKGEITYA